MRVTAITRRLPIAVRAFPLGRLVRNLSAGNCAGFCRVRHKPKMTVVLTKSARFDDTIMAEGAHGSYANDDEDTYEDADYSDAAFQDPRVPDVGEGDINQVRSISREYTSSL